jgi:hypothetical protein
MQLSCKNFTTYAFRPNIMKAQQFYYTCKLLAIRRNYRFTTAIISTIYKDRENRANSFTRDLERIEYQET